MKYIEMHDGGMPLDLDDINYGQNAVKEALQGFIGAICRENCILQGCVVTETAHHSQIMYRVVTITSGFAWIGGEICRVESQQIELRPTIDSTTFDAVYPDIVLEKQAIYHTQGFEVFMDGVSRDTYAENVGVLKTTFTSNVFQMPVNTPTLRQILGLDMRDIAANRGLGWNGSVIVRRLNGGCWLLSGRLEGLSANPMLTLHPSCRPSQVQICASVSDTGETIALRLNTDGSVIAIGSTRPITCNMNLLYI